MTGWRWWGEVQVTSQHYTIDFDLLYTHGRHGWSILRVFHPDIDLTIRITHIFGNPLERICDFCCLILSGEPCVDLFLPDEPGGIRIEALRNLNAHHLVRLTFFDCSTDGDGKTGGSLVLSMDVRASHFAGLVHHELNKLRWLMKDKSFRADRSPLPHAHMAKLERLMSL
jgi:hypothetical protein